jgi:hypothetical protein
MKAGPYPALLLHIQGVSVAIPFLGVLESLHQVNGEMTRVCGATLQIHEDNQRRKTKPSLGSIL